MSENPRRTELERRTGETEVRLALDLDGTGTGTISTGIPFYDHMLQQLARHGRFDLEVAARGDLEVDAHHTVEDVALVLGEAFDRALGERADIGRFGWALTPLDEALAEAVVDFGGRPYVVFQAPGLEGRRGEQLGGLPVDLVEHFFESFAARARANVHVTLRHGRNLHHCVEAMFKAFARACRQACERDPRGGGVPSTKGTLEA